MKIKERLKLMLKFNGYMMKRMKMDHKFKETMVTLNKEIV